jgi:hypothetical protein
MRNHQPTPTLQLPRICRGIVREMSDGSARRLTQGGVEPARADCTKLHGPAREMCYLAQSSN